MTGDVLPDSAHVVHYVRPTSIFEDGSIDIRLRSREPALSVHCLECFGDLPKEQQLAQVRRVSRLTLSKNGRLVEWQVGPTTQYLLDEAPSIRFVSKPLAADQNHEADPSHSEIEGLPPRDSPQADLLGDMIAQCIMARHPAVVS